MKRITCLYLALAGLVSLVSCNKEGGEDGGKTVKKDFTAVAPVTKAAIDGNDYLWEEGDVIFICSNTQDAGFSGSPKGAVKIVLDASKISEDGKTAYFSADVPASASMYYAYSVGKDEKIIKSFSKSGTATFAAVDASDSEIRCAAFAVCLPANKKFTFSPVLSPVNFQVSGAYKVVLEGKNGETVTDDFTVNGSGKTTLCGTSAKKAVTAMVKDAENAYFYLAPGISLKGYKLSVYKDENTLDYEVVSDADLIVETGAQVRLGEIVPGGSKDLYADWMAGKSVDFYRKSFSKESGVTAVMVTAADANAKGEFFVPETVKDVAYFVAPDVTLVVDNVLASGTVLIVGNNMDRKSDVRIDESFATPSSGSSNFVFGMKNVSCVSHASNSVVNPTVSEDGQNRVSCHIDHCSLDLPYDSYMLVTRGNLIVDDFIMSNTYWKIKPMTASARESRNPKTHSNEEIANLPANQGLIRVGSSTEAWGDLRFFNNVFYCSDGFNEFVLTEETTAYEERNYTHRNVEFVNNTVINLSGYVSRNNKAVIGGGAGTYDSLDIANNIFYNDYDYADAWMFIYRTNNSDKLTLNEGGHVRIGDEGSMKPVLDEDGNETGEIRLTFDFKANNYFYLGEDAVKTSVERNSMLAVWTIVPGMTGAESERHQYCWEYSGEDNPFSFLNKSNGTYEVRKAFKGMGASIK